MQIYQAKNYEEMSRKAANILSAQMIMKPACVLGLATGSTPVGVYRQLVHWYRNGDLDFSQVRTVNLDEYKGLSPQNPQSYRSFMDKNLFSHVNIRMENTHLPDGLAADDQAECTRYNGVIQALGGIDLQLLGIGKNGHIGFNEPDVAFEKLTHCEALTDSTIQANARLFSDGEQVPRYAYTMGIKSIMQARKIVMVANGTEKASILREAFFGPVTPHVPASILQLHHDVTLVADEAALAGIREAADADHPVMIL